MTGMGQTEEGRTGDEPPVRVGADSGGVGGGLAALPANEGAGPEYVERALRCGSCGYELRGLARGGVCPECGAEVAASLRPHALRAAAPEYLATLKRGATVVEVGAVFRVISVVVVWFSGVLISGSSKAMLGVACSLAASVAFVAGWWWLSTPDLRRAELESRFSLRRRARASAIALAVVAGILLAFDAIRAQGTAAPGSVRTLFVFVWLGVLVVQFFSEVDFYVDLAKRAEDPGWEDWMRTCRWLVPVGLLLFVVGGVIVYLMMLDSVRRGIGRVEARQRMENALGVEVRERRWM